MYPIVTQVEDLAFAPDGTLWAATSDGVVQFDGKTWMNYTTLNGLPENYIDTIAVDEKGIVWVAGGNPAKIFSFEGKQWQKHGTDRVQDIYSIVSGRDGTVWFGTSAPETNEAGGVLCFSFGEWGTCDTGLEGLSVWALAFDSNNTLWAATRKGLAWFDKDRWHIYPIELFWANTGDVTITHIAASPDGSLWFTTQGKGLTHFRDGVWSNYHYPAVPLPSGLVASHDGRIWISDWRASDNPQIERALVSFDGIEWTEYELPTPIMIVDMEQASDGSLWFATAGAVVQYLPEK